MHRGRLIQGTAILLILGGCLALRQSGSEPHAPGIALLDTAVLLAPRLGESSGAVVSRRNPGIVWTHNDSGDGPYLYATDSAGTDLGFVRIGGARAVDWEDIAAGPCVRTRDTCLYISDTGDNAARRPYGVIYRVVEPAPPRSPADTARVIAILDSLVVRFPDRPRDAEGLAITPDGWLLLVSKDRSGPPRLYRARVPAASEVVQLEDRGPLPITWSLLRGRIVTAADASPDGSLFVARTYVSIHLFSLANGVVEPLMAENGVPVPVVEDQGEAVAFSGIDRLVLTSERGQRRHAIMQRLTITGLAR